MVAGIKSEPWPGSNRNPRPACVGIRTKTLGISGQTLHNWVKAEAAGQLRDVAGKTISAEQMEITRLKAELARTRTERDILKKAAAYFARESR